MRPKPAHRQAPHMQPHEEVLHLQAQDLYLPKSLAR